MARYEIARQGYRLHVHKVGCRDLARLHPSEKWTVEGSSLRDVVEDTYGPAAGSFYRDAGYVPGTPEYENAWEDFMHDFRVMPCAGALPTDVNA
jgi:hypothetical protein